MKRTLLLTITAHALLFSQASNDDANDDANDAVGDLSPPTARIVGGSVVNPEDRYPYQVTMISDRRGFYCGGSLVDKDWVLCAAHCAGLGDRVYVGRHDLGDRWEDYENIEIDAEYPHPDYDDETLDNDFMMVRLSRSSAYDPVRLDDGSANVNSGADVTVMGWGTTSFGGSISWQLLEVEVDVVGNTRCNMNYWGGITDNMMCAARSGKDACQGDSGGPLIVKGNDASGDVQVGVVSWGNGCANSRYPGVYARISSQIDWINGHIESTGGGGGNHRDPTPDPTPNPTRSPVRNATPAPVRDPTPAPVRDPTPAPSLRSSSVPSSSPKPSVASSSVPTARPTISSEPSTSPAPSSAPSTPTCPTSYTMRSILKKLLI